MTALRLATLASIFALLAGCGGPTKPTEPPPPATQPGGNPPAPPKPTTPDTPDKPDFITTAEDISKEVFADEKAANAKYKGKWVELTGRVFDANKTFSRTGFMLLGGKKKETDAVGYVLVVEVPPADAAKLWGLSKNQKVKVVARVAGFNSAGGRFEQATLTELEPSKLLKVTAEDLAAEYAKDGEATHKKYLGDGYSREIAIGGTVADKTEERGFKFVILAGSGKTRVQCTFDEQDWKTLNKGDKVTIKGDLSSFDSAKDNTITVNTAFLVKKD